MLTVKEWMELVDYRITEGGEYGWRCFGDDAYSLSSWNGEQDGWSFDIVFDRRTQEVYTVEVCDYKRQRAYRMIHPDFQQAYNDEAATHGTMAKQAWDDVDYIDLEIDEDFAAKALWIKTDQDYDTRVSIPLELPDDVMFTLMKQAHEQDITFNEHMENILRAACEEALADPEAYKRKMELNDDEFWDKLAEENLQDLDDWEEMSSDLEDIKPKKKRKKK